MLKNYELKCYQVRITVPESQAPSLALLAWHWDYSHTKQEGSRLGLSGTQKIPSSLDTTVRKLNKPEKNHRRTTQTRDKPLLCLLTSLPGLETDKQPFASRRPEPRAQLNQRSCQETSLRWSFPTSSLTRKQSRVCSHCLSAAKRGGLFCSLPAPSP